LQIRGVVMGRWGLISQDTINIVDSNWGELHKSLKLTKDVLIRVTFGPLTVPLCG